MYNKLGINENTYKVLFEPIKLNKDTVKDKKKEILEEIEKFTLGISNKKKNKHIKAIGTEYYFNTKNKIYNFRKISSSVRDNYLYQNLETYNRYQKCHGGSLTLVKKELFPDSVVVSSYVIDDEYKYLHTWLEYNNLVIDYTKNLVMNCEDYYNLVNISIINKIASNDAIKYFDFPFLVDGIFCLFDKELTTDIEKNKFLVKKKTNF